MQTQRLNLSKKYYQMTKYPVTAVTVLTASLLSSAFSVNAQSNALLNIPEVKSCMEKHKDRIDYSRCLDNALLKLDREMTTWENNVEFKLRELSEGSGRSDALLVFNRASQQFQKFKKTNCQWQYLAMLPDVSAAKTMVKECQIYMTKDRINKLSEISEFDF